MNLSPEVAALLNEQINAEWFAAYFYASLSAWADAGAFPGLKAWADKASREEREHAQMFTDYLSDRGGTVELTPIAAPPAVFKTYAEALGAALQAEEAVTAHLLTLAAAKDGPVAHLANGWINTEQVPAIKEIQDFLLIVGRGAPIDLLDRELFEAA